MTETRLPAKIGQMAAAAANGARWPFVASLEGTIWEQFPAAGTCANSIGAGSVRACRDFAVATLRRWELSDRWGLDDRHDDIAVVVSELVTNALRHALPAAGPNRGLARVGWPVQVGMTRAGRSVLCAVSDPSDRLPMPREPDLLDETGRGLQVVASLSDEWGYSAPSAMGKIVWARFSTVARLRLPLSPIPAQRGLRAMYDRGELVPEADPDQLALATLTALQGGLLMTQSPTRHGRPLEAALDAMLERIAGSGRGALSRTPTPTVIGLAEQSASPQSHAYHQSR